MAVIAAGAAVTLLTGLLPGPATLLIAASVAHQGRSAAFSR